MTGGGFNLSQGDDKLQLKQAFSLQDQSNWEIMRLPLFPTQESWKMKKTVLKTSALLMALGLLAGCAASTDLESKVDRAAADAAAAASAAEAARAAADRAAQAAASAQSTADQALSAATQSQACCEANKEAMERMFQRSQSK